VKPTVIWSLTRRCNLRCRHCSTTSSDVDFPGELTQDEAMARIGEFLRDTPVLSLIPSDTATSELRVRHGGYDITSALRDANVTFPIDRLRTARDNDAVGDLASTFFSFPGATSNGRLRQELPGWVERIHEEDVDVMLLVPV